MTLSWVQIFRLGLVQACLGAIVVLMTSTLNRLMVVELALPVVLPGFLVALHYGVQITRPNWGHLADQGGNRTRWIIAGMALLALGGLGAAAAIPLLESHFGLGLALSLLAYAVIGLGVGASGTSLLALLATATAEHRRPAAATITWLMMIAGIALTAITAGKFLDPYSHARLMVIVAIICTGAVALTILAVWGIERRVVIRPAPPPVRFRDGMRDIWADTRARNFTFFVFLSMTAYFMQELILEPYAGLVFNYTPGQSTQMSGAQNGGVFLGMVLVGVAASGLRLGSLRAWVVAGCIGSAVMLVAIAGASLWVLPLVPLVVALGFFNGMFAVAAIGSMMQLAGEGQDKREGTRVGLWGASQAIAAGFGGLTGAALVDLARSLLPVADAFGAVFLFQATIFIASAALAARIMSPRPRALMVPGE
ncbi:BCD family MFS transporter [Roseinatronobacter bogoriensis]|jgi:BCD family chlorophyll transporter-like MFS transporter|uniref:MFS transporter n=1 Tax=Roseinatronobacter bogoriensis subsp. barguzinensis TaxID=441209 RepID=A0A2K8KFI6_9RHOB|nr:MULTISPECIES: BCD family MFS transporter [Rhodobaca]ATX64920.1 MFS transporter [Rhodobaca barguzinensis]MBB4208732.1 BCD family chlorophyll transporter-like MFS transporter [Rhodobaca bogoriensis DSM 18756]TDW38000.1 BCD family chlorophyll transporter-like MFS transporter [Rhodobaca barguzinensis]TDY69830.1 BCD family chlorophyll transporter-like MFS transporter [Rhodobaca bogoriensis DSM 18756]